MNKIEMLNWLEQEITNFPERKTGENFYDFILKQVGKVMPNSRLALVSALTEWILIKNSVRTDLAMEIARFYNLKELRSTIENLLNEVKTGQAFLPYYSERIEKVLNTLL